MGQHVTKCNHVHEIEGAYVGCPYMATVKREFAVHLMGQAGTFYYRTCENHADSPLREIGKEQIND